jgi:hypothetical protein
MIARPEARRVALRWIAKADEDLAAAERLMSLDDSLAAVVCFHCQQAVEKPITGHEARSAIAVATDVRRAVGRALDSTSAPAWPWHPGRCLRCPPAAGHRARGAARGQGGGHRALGLRGAAAVLAGFFRKEGLGGDLSGPCRRWVASTGEDNTLRLWPMPDLSKPPLHTLPRSELIAKLKSLTNLRAVRDATSATGWKIELGPFPGWKDVPTW